MAQASFTVNNSAAAAKTFNLDSQGGRDSSYVESTATRANRIACAVKHTMQKVGASGSDRHLVQFTQEAVNATSGAVSTAIINVTISVPKTEDINDTQVLDLWYFAKNYLTDVNFGKMLDGVTP